MATDTSGWSAHDGTNLDCGLRLADYQLKQNTVAKISKNLKNVIVLSDGEPTFYLSKGVSIKGSIKIGNTKYYVHGSGKDCKKDTYNTTKSTAATLRNSASVYTVCFGASGNEIKDYDKNGNQKITVGNYLKQKIATQPKSGSNEKFAYDAADADALNTAFAAISKTIVSGLSTGTVKDTLPTGISSTVFGEGKTVMNWELNSDAFNKTEETKPLADGTKETVYTYTKTYTVTIDPDNENLVKTEDGYAPLNGKTTLTVKNSQGTDVEIPFPIPAGKVTMPSYTVTYTDGVDSEVVFENVEKTAAYKAAIPAYGDSNPTRTGYTFTSWKWYNATDTTYANEITPAPTTMPAYNLVAVAQWTPATDTKYIVEHYLQNLTGDGYTKQETETKAGTTGATATAAAKTYTGFMFDENNVSNVKSGTIAANGSLVLKLYYTRNKHSITYTYTDTSTVPEGAPDLPAAEANVPFGAPKNVAAVPTLAGYTFTGWTLKSPTSLTIADNGTFTMPDSDVVFEGSWTKNGDAGYKIEYYLETLATGTFERDDTLTSDEKSGTIGTTAEVEEADKKPITGFTFDVNNTNNKLEGEIVSGDPLTLKLYYTRNSYTVKYQYTGTVPTGASTLPPEVTYKYGAEVTVAENATAPDHDFSGWGTTDASINNDKFVMPAKNVTLTGSWTLKDPTAVNVDLNDHIYKTFTSDTVDIPNDELTFNVTVRGTSDNAKTMTRNGSVEFTKQDVQNNTTSKAFTFASNPLTFTAAGEYTFEVVEGTTPVINGLTYNVNNETPLFTIVVDKKENANELYVKEVRVGTTNYEGVALTDTLAYATITNTYTEPKNAQVTNKEVVVTQPEGALKTAVNAFEITSRVTVLYPTGNGTTSNTLEVSYGTTAATLLYKITVYAGTESSYTFEDKDASFVYAENAKTVTKNGDYFTVTFEDGAEYAYVYVAVTHAISYDADGEYKARNFIGSQGAETTVTEKDPNKLTINFADYVQKELTATGSKTASDVNFTVNVKESPIHVINSTQGEEAVSTYAGELLSTTLNAHFDSITGGETKTTPFTGSVEITSAGQYIFELREEDGQRTGVTYDETIYTLHVLVDEKEGSLAVTRWYFTDSNRVEHNAGEKAAFHNTIDTGKDDYYPIIIPTIINKDTGMLNKTDHFAYVIGYPDGTVHPNGQITRAEVATIFFRLLRDEVRDGAFTTSNSYSDVAYGKWYNNPISTMSALGIITGYPDGTFKPNKPITRAEFAAIAARFDETQSGKSATFSDVIGHWAAKEIGIAYANEWIKGYPDGTFKPDQNITRAEAMTLINRVLERKPESPADLLTNMNKWTDNLDTSKWYYLDVQEATNSHAYTRKTFNYELWRQMLPDPDWSRYER